MDELDTLEVFDCPRCQGPAVLEEEGGWCVYVQCMDCGAHTAELRYSNEEERIIAAKKAVSTWNMGKSIYTGGTGD